MNGKVLSTSEFALALGVNKGIISLAKKGGHLYEDSPGKYDITDTRNAFWIQSQIMRNGKKWDISRIDAEKADRMMQKMNKAAMPRVKKEKKVELAVDTHADISEIPIVKSIPPPVYEEQSEVIVSVDKKKKKVVDEFDMKTEIVNLQQEKLKAEIKKLKNSDKLEQLRIAKLEGSLLPVEFVDHIFNWCTESMKKTWENEVESIASTMVTRLGGKQTDFIEIKKNLLIINAEIGQTYKENLQSGLQEQVENYQEVRAKGERK